MDRVIDHGEPQGSRPTLKRWDKGPDGRSGFCPVRSSTHRGWSSVEVNPHAMKLASDSDLISAIRFEVGHPLGIASARPLGGTRPLLVRNDERGTDASRESADATSTRDPRLKHECGASDHEGKQPGAPTGGPITLLKSNRRPPTVRINQNSLAYYRVALEISGGLVSAVFAKYDPIIVFRPINLDLGCGPRMEAF
jgi:hypothetical protein